MKTLKTIWNYLFHNHHHDERGINSLRQYRRHGGIH